MGNINRIPSGYLSLLGSTTGGRNPPESSDLVQPTVEMNALLAANRMSSEFLSFTPAGLPESASLVVPPNEVWIMKSGSYSQTVQLVTDVCQCSISVRRLPAAGANVGFAPIFVGERLIATTLTAGPQLMQQAFLFPENFVLQGGSELIGTVNEQLGLRFVSFAFSFIRLNT